MYENEFLIYDNEEMKQNLLNILNNKKVYIFENDTCLQDSLTNFCLFCKDNNIHVDKVFNLNKQRFEFIQAVLHCDSIIVYETQMRSEIGDKILKYIVDNKLEHLTIIECNIRRTIYNNTHNLNINKINLECYSQHLDFWEIQYLKNHK